MLTVIIWALLTGGLTGGVWVSIVLLQRQRALADANRELFEERQEALARYQALAGRVTELEDRLDFTERLLNRGQAQPEPPSGSP